MLHLHITRSWRRKIGAGASATIMSAFGLAASVPANADTSVDDIKTVTPIKHVIIIVGENRSFDHVFATYQPKNGEHVDNLLSKGIVKPDGTPGPNYALSTQYNAMTMGARGSRLEGRTQLPLLSRGAGGKACRAS